jgi:hypothetical protein
VLTDEKTAVEAAKNGPTRAENRPGTVEYCAVCGAETAWNPVWERRLFCSDSCREEGIRRLKWSIMKP